MSSDISSARRCTSIVFTTLPASLGDAPNFSEPKVVLLYTQNLFSYEVSGLE